MRRRWWYSKKGREMMSVLTASPAKTGSGHDADSVWEPVRLMEIIDMSEMARLSGDPEGADRLLLEAWAAYDGG